MECLTSTGYTPWYSVIDFQVFQLRLFKVLPLQGLFPLNILFDTEDREVVKLLNSPRWNLG